MRSAFCFAVTVCLLFAQFSAALQPSEDKCLTTLGAVEHNHSSSEWPLGGREVVCRFHADEVCYAFARRKRPQFVEYGCARRSFCGGNSECVEKATGKLCCCATSMCNVPVNVEQILPTTTPPTTTTTLPPLGAPIDGWPLEAFPEDGVWLDTPFTFFALFTFTMLIVLCLFLWYIHTELKLFHEENLDIDKHVNSRLQRCHDEIIDWTTDRMSRATRIVMGEKVPPLEKVMNSSQASGSTKDTTTSRKK